MVDEDIRMFMRGSVPLGAYSGLEFQQGLGLKWQPLEYSGFDNLKYSIGVYYEEYSEPSTTNKTLLAYRKKVLNKEGYLFHITGKLKDYIGFRKLKWTDARDIYEDLLVFEEDEEE